MIATENISGNKKIGKSSNSFGLTEVKIKNSSISNVGKDEKLFEASLFDVASSGEIKDSSLADSFDNFVKSEPPTADNPDEPTKENNNISMPEYITKNLIKLLTETNKHGVIIAAAIKINPKTILSVMENYSNAYKIRTDKYGNNLIEDLILSNLSNKIKTDCLTLIKDAFDKRISELTGDTSYTSKAFQEAINDAVANKDTKELISLTERYIKIVKRLETMDARNRSVKYESHTDVTVNPCYEAIKLGTDDYFGNGKLADNFAKQGNGNCYAHGYSKNMRKTDYGTEYLDNLVVKTHSVISVYLPAAADKNLPEGRGDGIYTYTPKDLATRAHMESVGDGDLTAFCMAITDYRGAVTGNPKASSYGGNPKIFNEIIFGENYNNEPYNSIIINNPVHFYPNTYANKKDLTQKEIVEQEELYRKNINYDISEEDARKRCAEIKKYMDDGQGYLCIDIDRYRNSAHIRNAKIIVERCDDNYTTNIPTSLAFPHAYSIKEIQDDYIILSESNHPKLEYKLTPYQFVSIFTVIYNKYPEN